MSADENGPLWKREHLLSLSWQELGVCMESLREQILDSGFKPTCIVGICRGGLVLATCLSNVFDIRNFQVLGIARNLSNDRYSQRAPARFDWLSPERGLKGERVLIADDIAGDGGTLALACETLRGYEPEEIRTAVIVKNQGSKITPDYFAVSVDDWVVFPWEARAATASVEPLKIQWSGRR